MTFCAAAGVIVGGELYDVLTCAGSAGTDGWAADALGFGGAGGRGTVTVTEKSRSSGVSSAGSVGVNTKR
jgi:hypothetical protein